MWPEAQKSASFMRPRSGREGESGLRDLTEDCAAVSNLSLYINHYARRRKGFAEFDIQPDGPARGLRQLIGAGGHCGSQPGPTRHRLLQLRPVGGERVAYAGS